MIRTIINLEPGGDQSRSRVLAEITIINLTRGDGRLSSDYAWRVRKVDPGGRMTTAYGCLVDSYNENSVDLLWEVLQAWKSGTDVAIDNHGQPVRLINDHEAYWKAADPSPCTLLNN